MADFDAILFFMMLGLAFIFMFATHPDRNRIYAFRFLSTILFFACAMILASDADIVFKTVIDRTPDPPFTDKKYIFENNQMFLGWILIIIGLMNLIMTFISMSKYASKTAEGKPGYEEVEW